MKGGRRRERFALASVLILVLGCQSVPPRDAVSLAGLLPADTTFYLQLNLQPDNREFLYQAMFRPVLGDADWVEALLRSSTAAAVGINAQGQVSAVLDNNYSKFLLNAGLSGRKDWHQRGKQLIFSSEIGVLDLSRPELLYFSQQADTSLDLSLPSGSPWPEELLVKIPQQLAVFYSPEPSQLPFWQHLPLATDTFEEFRGWIGPGPDKPNLVLQLSTPSSTRTRALLTNLRLILPPLLLTSGIDVLRQQARRPEIAADGRQLTLKLRLNAEALADLLTRLVPKQEI